MNCKKINIYPIAEYLAKLGITPKYKRNEYYRYYSPLRKENTPSFDVSLNKNVWIDRGTGEGGTLIDLCMRLENISVSEVVKKFNYDSFSFRQLKPAARIEKPPNYRILSKELLKEERLCDYLESRAIKLSIAKRIVKEYHYSLYDRKYFALGIDNINGGVELRNKYFKGTIGPKAISYFKGINNKLLLFEGFMDLMSHLTYSKVDQSCNHILVLNSTNNTLSAVEHILKLPKNIEIFHFLDRDEAGNRAVEVLNTLDNTVCDMSYIYNGYNDYNEMLMHKANIKESKCKTM